MFRSRTAVATAPNTAAPDLAPAANVKTGAGLAVAPVYRLREVSQESRGDVRELTRLHMKLLGHGPMARLGTLFLERFCYTVLIRESLLKAVLLEIEGRAV